MDILCLYFNTKVNDRKEKDSQKFIDRFTKVNYTVNITEIHICEWKGEQNGK